MKFNTVRPGFWSPAASNGQLEVLEEDLVAARGEEMTLQCKTL